MGTAECRRTVWIVAAPERGALLKSRTITSGLLALTSAKKRFCTASAWVGDGPAPGIDRSSRARTILAVLLILFVARAEKPFRCGLIRSHSRQRQQEIFQNIDVFIVPDF